MLTARGSLWRDDIQVTDPVVVAFDHRSLDWLADRHEHNAAYRRKSPVVWNPAYGGFWFVTGYEEVAAVARDSGAFSPFYAEATSDGLTYIGIMGVPRRPGTPSAGIAEADSVIHSELRRVLNPFLLPAAVNSYRPFIEQLVTWCIDQRISDGKMDLVVDLTSPVPAVLTMILLGLDPASGNAYGSVFHDLSAHNEDEPEHAAAQLRLIEILGEAFSVAQDRRRQPRNDILSELVTMKAAGRSLTDEEVLSVMFNLIGGGLDTTTSLTSLALHHLEAHPDIRSRLAEHPDLLGSACEEYLRWTSVNETLTRTCTRDTELGGQHIRRGDIVMISWLGANFDPAVFDQPDEVDVERAPNPHLSFGVGAHRCIGMHLARMLFPVMVSAVLSRLPDYTIDHDATAFYAGNPLLAGVVKLPVTFTPGPQVGVARPF
jgi:cytochrome P450